MSATLRELGVLLERLGKELQTAAAVPATDLGLVEPDELGLGRQARDAIRAGALVGFRVGHRLFCKRDDFLRWVQSQPALPRSSSTTEGPAGDDVDRVIEMNHHRRRRRAR